MKKIVALVLSLVMVMGLATVASAATTTPALYDLHQADVNGTEIAGDIGYTAKDAVVNADGSGVLAYYVMNSAWYVEIDAADATTSDFYVTKANEKTPLFYLAHVTDSDDIAYQFVAEEFSDVGVKCGQMNVPYTYTVAELGLYVWTNPVDKTKTYFVEYDEDFDYGTLSAPYFNGATLGTAYNLLVDDEIVTAKVLSTTTSPLNQHAWSPVAYDKTVPTKALCGLCGAEAVVYKNGKAPAGSDYYDVTFGATAYDLVVVAATSAPAADAADKVESAQTFDAGIAMYVGMSVMAAAGSAVVLKKKD